jgi:hypothetical protein
VEEQIIKSPNKDYSRTEGQQVNLHSAHDEGRSRDTAGVYIPLDAVTQYMEIQIEFI